MRTPEPQSPATLFEEDAYGSDEVTLMAPLRSPLAPSAELDATAPLEPARVAPREARGAAVWLRELRAAPLVRKLLVSLLPGVMVLGLVAARSRLSLGAPSAAASVTPVAPAASSGTGRRPATVPTPKTAPIGADAPDRLTARVAPTAQVVAPEAPPATPSRPRSSVLERRAISALKRGSFDEAAELYAELAREHADSPLYRDAARLARRKARGAR